MVPGMAERERRAVDMRRREWLADSGIGPGPRTRASPVDRLSKPPHSQALARALGTLNLSRLVHHGLQARAKSAAGFRVGSAGVPSR